MQSAAHRSAQTTAKETYFTNVVCVKREYVPWTHESFYAKYKVPSDFQCKVWLVSRLASPFWSIRPCDCPV